MNIEVPSFGIAVLIKSCDVNSFYWDGPNFQGHHTIKTVKMSFICSLSPEPMGGILPNFGTVTPLGHGKEMIRFW